MLEQFIQFIYSQFLPKNMHGEEIASRIRVRFFVATICLFLLSTFTVAVTWLIINEWSIRFIEGSILGISFVIQLSSLLYFRYRGHLEFVAKNLIWCHYLLVLVLVLFSGGIYSPFIISFIFMPVFASFLVNATHCKAMLLCSVVLLILLSTVNHLYIELPEQIIPYGSSLDTVLTTTGLLLIIAIFASYELTLKALRKAMMSEKSHFLNHAEYEPLTGMLSYMAFENLLHSNLEQKIPFALFYIDVDNFRNINHIHGHSIGDKILQQVAARISNIIRNDDVVSRIKSDEFALLIQHIDEETDCDDIVQKIKQAVSATMKLENGEIVNIQCSVGYHSTLDGGETKSSLYAIAKSRLSSV